ncbi:hypothetical protein B9Z55_012897 [Caenorhabditis nigoni]|nr:hypothetical protein B9Z55_012897 [Caenorhabditis nigoni]
MLLTKSQQFPTLSFFTQFYLRRFKRILPLYFLLILCAVTALYTVFPTAPILQNQMSAGKALIFTSNRPHTEDEDYFEKLSIAMDLFTHTWSLSVEIQFYFIVPFIFLIGLQLKGASRYVYYVCLSLLSFAFHASSATSVAFNSVFARIWQFSIGMISYFIVDNQYKSNTFFYKPLENAAKQEGPGLFILVKYTVLIISMFIILITVEVTPLPARFLITIFTGILIVLDAEDLVLNSRFLIFFGDISYALYLIHWPIYAYVKLTYPANTWILTSALIISILLAFLVHQTFERWYLRQSNNMITILVVSLFFLNVIVINWYEIRENVDEVMNNVLFFAVAEPYDNGPDNLNNDTIYLEMKSQLKKMLPNIKKKLFILDSLPRIQTEGVGKIAEEMKKGKKTMEEINKSLYDPFHYERGRHRYAELVKNECGSKCEMIDYVDAFWNKTMNAFQYFDSKGFTYFTVINHLSAHGLEHVRPIYNKICAGL